MGFRQAPSDPSLFLRGKNDSFVALLVYVDDVVIASSNLSQVQQIKSHLDQVFHIKDLGTLKFFLGLEIARNTAPVRGTAAAPVFAPVAPVRDTPAYAPRQGQTRAPGTSFASSTGSRPVAAPRPATSVPRSGGAVSSGSQPPERRLPRSEYQRRRDSGLCFHCDERWTPAHNCRHLFMLVIDDCEPQPVDNGDGFEPFETEQVDFASLEISLHAITGTGNGNTMRVNLCLNNRPITALIDSGSTHNFVDSATAKELGLLIRACPFLQVAVANGERITGLGVCEDVLLQKDSNYFPVNLFVIPLVGFEIVLGVHWLRTLGAILWDFTALTMTFTYGGRPVTWQGDQVSPGQFLHAIQPHVNVSNALEHLLTDFSDLFQEPTALPPKRQCDHRITLVTGADPVAVRPYRYPQAQKDEIERQCWAPDGDEAEFLVLNGRSLWHCNDVRQRRRPGSRTVATLPLWKVDAVFLLSGTFPIKVVLQFSFIHHIFGWKLRGMRKLL
nr:uncharacterized protein LOC109178468 [Ipomoea batatas]